MAAPPPNPLSTSLALVLPSGNHLGLPTIDPDNLPQSQSFCISCLTSWGRKTKREGVLEMPFIVQPCQHILGSACLHRVIDETDLRCPICGVKIQLEGHDGLSHSITPEDDGEENDDSPLSTAPNSPIWPEDTGAGTTETDEDETQSEISSSSRFSTPAPIRKRGGHVTPPTSPLNPRESPLREGRYMEAKSVMHISARNPHNRPWELEDEQDVQAALTLLRMKHAGMWEVNMGETGRKDDGGG